MSGKNAFFGAFEKEFFCIRTNRVFYFAWAFYDIFLSFRFFFGMQFFSGGVSADLRLFFASVPYICIIAVPLLAQIVSLKPFDELMPLNAVSLFLAKLSALAISFAVMNLPLIFVPISVSFFGDVDISQTVFGFSGVIFYGIFAFSLSIFVSLLCRSAPLSLLFSVGLLAFFNSAHLFAVYTGITGRAAGILQAVSFAWHFDAAGKGIFDSRDFFFYIIWTAFFLCAAAFAFSLKKGERRFVRIFAFFAIDCVLLTAISSRFFIRADFSRDRRFSVSPYSVRALEKADENLRIKYFLSPSLRRLYPQVRDVQDFLFQYCEKAKNAELQIINPDSESGRAGVSSYSLVPQQFRTTGKNKTEYISVYSAIVLEDLDKSETISFELSADTLEYDLTRAVEKIVSGIERKALIVSGNDLDIDADYSYVRPWLKAAGIKTDAVLGADLTENILQSDVPIVVFGSSAFTKESAETLSHFLESGGRAFFAVDISSDWNVSEKNEDFVLEMLEAKGITIEKKIAADVSSARIVLDSADGDGAAMQQDIFNYPLWVSILPQKRAENGVTVFWGNPVSVDSAGTPLLSTTKFSWLLEKQNDSEFMFDTNPFRVSKSAPDGSVQGSFFLGAERGGIIVVGDQYFASSLMLSYINSGSDVDFRNLDFLVDAVLHLQNADGLSSLRRSRTSSALYKITDEENFSRAVRLSLAITFVLPALLVIASAIFSAIRRKREFDR